MSIDNPAIQADQSMLDDGDDFDPYGDASPAKVEQNTAPLIEKDFTKVESASASLPGLGLVAHSSENAGKTQEGLLSASELPLAAGLDEKKSASQSASPPDPVEHLDTKENDLSASHETDQYVGRPPSEAATETDLRSSTAASTSLPGLGLVKDDTLAEIAPKVEETVVQPIAELPEVTDAEIILQQDIQPAINDRPIEDGAEVEYDSSPYESSTEDSSSDDSDDSDDDYELLDPVEQARRLMEGDGSDDEGGKTTNGGQLRTANEKIEDVVEIPKIEGLAELKIEELGNVEAKVDNIILIKAKTSGEYQVLESGSVLCLPDRTVIGAVSETLGRVQEPLYCVRFTSAKTIAELGLETGTTLYYIPQHSTFVFTQALQAVKGSDASNIHDEEIGGDEIEFSDDEAEAEYKRQKKLQKQERKEQRGVSSRGRGGARFDSRNHEPQNPSTLSYDEMSIDDGLYTPLSRPANLNVPGAAVSVREESDGYSRGAGGMRGRGRGNGGRGGNRGRGDRRNQPNGRQPQFNGNGSSTYTNQGQQVQQPYPPAGNSYSPMQQQNPYGQPQQQYQAFNGQAAQQPNYYQQFQSQHPLATAQQHFQQYQQQAYAPPGQWAAFQQTSTNQGASPSSAPQAAPSGPNFPAHFNPAMFFQNQYQQQQQQPPPG